MGNFHDFVVTVVAFVILIGVMVFFHELGHFLAAKFFGVRVESFSIGFGPRLFGFRRGETDYKICALPLGGYVAMTGESMPGENMNVQAEDREVIEAHKQDPGALTSHPRWQRIIIGAAGPIANFILAFVFMAFYYGVFNEVPKYQVSTTTVEWVIPGSPAAQAGIQPGDVIKHFDTADNPDWLQVGARASLNFNQTVPVTVERAGQPVQLSIHIPELPKGHDFDFNDLGVLPQVSYGPISVTEVQPSSPADKAGLRAGDQIATIDGHAFHYVGTLQAYLASTRGQPVALGVQRNGSTLNLTATPTHQGAAWMIGIATVALPYRNDPMPLGKALIASKDFCITNSTLVVDVLKGLFTHKVAVSQLAGPIGIARMAGQAAETKGTLAKFWTASAISLNLGIVNLLPFPILDGGMILFLLIEGTMRRDINLVVKERIYQAAFVVLVVFFAFIIFNDVTKLPIFTHVQP